MGDHVAIIGGSSPGRDHFPFPIPDLPGTLIVGNGSFYPLLFTTDEMCRWFYRIRKWHFSMTVNYQCYIPDDPEDPESERHIENGTASIEFDFERGYYTDDHDVTTVYAREADLARTCSEVVFNGSLGFDGGWNVDTAVGLIVSNAVTDVSLDDGSGELLLIVEFDLGAWEGIYWSDGIYPHVFFGMGIGSDDCRMDYTQNPNGNYTRDLGTITIDGKTVLARAFDLSGSPPWSGARCSDFTLQITPIGFWPYAVQPKLPDGVTAHPNAGLPVYDTATGAALRNPLTGF